MKLGVGYNVFSGVELLKPSILCIRSLAYKIVAVYSKIAITGEPAVPFLLDLLYDLQREGLVDAIIEVNHPIVEKPLLIQAEKRRKYELAREFCEGLGCTHFMGRDCDEFFYKTSLSPILTKYSESDMVVCPALDYVKSPTIRAKNTGRLHVTVFHKVDLPYRPIRCIVMMDMSRTVKAKKIVVLGSNELVMHHMTGVRYNEQEMNRKFQGHTHFCRNGQGNEKEFRDIIEKVSSDAYKEVPDFFNIQEYWKREFVEYYGR